jgi:hypothetical protein
MPYPQAMRRGSPLRTYLAASWARDGRGAAGMDLDPRQASGLTPGGTCAEWSAGPSTSCAAEAAHPNIGVIEVVHTAVTTAAVDEPDQAPRDTYVVVPSPGRASVSCGPPIDFPLNP